MVNITLNIAFIYYTLTKDYNLIFLCIIKYSLNIIKRIINHLITNYYNNLLL